MNAQSLFFDSCPSFQAAPSWGGGQARWSGLLQGAGSAFGKVFACLLVGLAPGRGAELPGHPGSLAGTPGGAVGPLDPERALPAGQGARPAPGTGPDGAAAGAPARQAEPAPRPGSGPFVLASDLFDKAPANPRPAEVRMGPDYVIGSGDQLALNAFGSVALSRTLKVDRGGKVAIPDVGLLPVGGLTLDAARSLVRAALRRQYAGLDQFNLEVVGLHDVELMVIGEVRHPGAYLAPSTSSPMSLLVLAGGPAENGSYRNIRHMRGGKLVQTLDLYRLRFEGKGLESRAFLDGDILFVPMAGTRITALGAFRRVAQLPEGPEAHPAGIMLELAPGESALEAVRFAGGLVPAASQVLLTIQRTSPAGISTVWNLRNQPADLRATRLAEADILRALPRQEREEEFVEAAGFVAVPGRYAFRPGMRVSDLLALGGDGGQVLPGTYRLRGEILRTHADGSTRLLSFDVNRALAGEPAHDLPLQARDRVALANVAELRLAKRVTILGPFTRPGVFDWHEGMRAADLIYRAGVPKLSAEGHYAELARLKDGRTSEVIRLDLARLVSTEEQATAALDDERINPALRPYDQITIYENPNFRMHRTVLIQGQVQRPGPYVIREDRFTLSQLISRAGGLAPDAMPSGGIFLRSGLEPRDPSARGAGAETTVGEAGAGKHLADINTILDRLNETRRGKESGALEPNPLLHGLLLGSMNRMVVDFTAVLKGDPRRDVVLLDGDQVFIPRRTDSVYVAGEVASSFSTFHVQDGDRVRDVLKLAGGYTRNADRSQVRLLKADGRIIDSRVEGAGIQPGDALLVPQRIRKDVPWQDSLLSMTPVALLFNAIRR